MKFEKGNKIATGRPKGVPNKPKNTKEKQIYEALIGSFKSGSYYVYSHVYDNKVFYIGKGINQRAWKNNVNCRNPDWFEFVNSINMNYEVRIIAANMSEEEALAIESALIKVNKPYCNIMYNHKEYTIKIDFNSY